MSWDAVSFSSPPIDWTLLAPDVPELKVFLNIYDCILTAFIRMLTV